MGNYRFNLSELIPNAWFYKLRDFGRKSSRKQQQKQQNITLSPSPTTKHHAVPTTTTTRSPRRSSYYSRPLKTATSTSPAAGRRLRHPPTVDVKSSAPKQLLHFSTTSAGAESFSPEFRSDQVLLPDDSLNHSSKAVTFTPPPPNIDLRPIVAKPANRSTAVRKAVAESSPAGMRRIRVRSPRVATRKSVRRSRAVVKASVDPRRDFKESMEEMIAENNIRASKDMEELLACYLCLNAHEYHSLIINVFKQIWLHLNLPQQQPLSP